MAKKVVCYNESMENIIEKLLRGVYMEEVRAYFNCSYKAADSALKLAVTKGLMTSKVELLSDSGAVIATYEREDEIPEKIKYYIFRDGCSCEDHDTGFHEDNGEFILLNTSNMRRFLRFYCTDADVAFSFLESLLYDDYLTD